MLELSSMPIDPPHHVAERALALGLDAAKHDARAGLHLLDRDAGLLGEGLEHEAVQVGVVCRVDDHLALRARGARAGHGGCGGKS